MLLTGWASFIPMVYCAENPTSLVAQGDPTDLPLDQLMQMPIPTVSGASRWPQKITEAPASVTIITSEEVKKYGYRTLAEALQSVRGFHVTEDRNYALLGVRGIQRGDFNNRVLLLVNGHRVNDSIKDAAFIGTEFILDVDLIDRVEVIRGPGSSLYGNNAFLGVINVITRTGRQFEGLGGEVSGEVGSYDTYKGRVSYGHRFTNDLEMLLSGTFYDSSGPDRLYFKGVTNDFGFAEGRDKTELESFFGSLRYHDIKLEGAYFRRDKLDPSAQYYALFNDPHNRTVYDRSYASLSYNHEFPEAVDVNARVYYDRNDFDITLPYPGLLYKELQVGEWWGAELQLSRLVFERHKLTVGGEYRDDFRQQRHSFYKVPSLEITNVMGSRDNYGIYLEGEFELLENLHLNAGGRYDQYADFDAAFNPRVALIWNPWKESAFKAIYGTAFRAPNFYEMTFTNLEPEEIQSFELVYEQGIGKYLRSTLGAYYNDVEDMITFEDGMFKNTDAIARGLEGELEMRLPWGMTGRASYAFQQARDKLMREWLPDSPRHLAKFNLSVPIIKEKLFAGLEFQYTSHRQTTRMVLLPSGQMVTEAGSGSAGFGVLNFTLLSVNLVKGLELSASIYNLLDREYADPATPYHFPEMETIPRDGRTFRVKLTYRF